MEVLPFFSIVIPTYNRAQLIAKPIESVLAQTYSNWELIVIDDGSTDNTKEIVYSYKEERIKYFYQNNAERSAARNNGISKAIGTYICFLDSDDSFLPDHLVNLLEFIIQNNSPNAMIFTNQVISRGINKFDSVEIVNFDQANAPIFFIKNSIVPGRICVSKSILLKMHFDEQIVIVEDTDLWFRISCHYPVYYLPKASFIYELHDDNSINVKNNAYKRRLDGLKRTFQNKEAQKIPKELKRELLSNCYFGILRYYVGQSKICNARMTILEAIIKFPSVRLKEKIYLLIFPRKAILTHEH